MLKDTNSIDSRDLEVIDQLDDGFSVGVRGVTVPHLETANQLQVCVCVVCVFACVRVHVCVPYTSE